MKDLVKSYELLAKVAIFVIPANGHGLWATTINERPAPHRDSGMVFAGIQRGRRIYGRGLNENET